MVLKVFQGKTKTGEVGPPFSDIFSLVITLPFCKTVYIGFWSAVMYGCSDTGPYVNSKGLPFNCGYAGMKHVMPIKLAML